MTAQSLAFIDNSRLAPPINWSTLGPPMRTALAELGAAVVAPGPLTRDRLDEWRGLVRRTRSFDHLFWMQLSARPPTPVLALAAAATPVRRSAYVLDAWPYVLGKVRAFATAGRLQPCFIAFREAFEILARGRGGDRYVHLPFAADLEVFKPSGVERDIFAFSMGRKHQPIDHALRAYCDDRNLTYVVSAGGAISDPRELGALVARSKYFVVTPPDLDHPQRSGGFSPLVMRYLEGLAAGARLLGTLPRSGEFEAMLPTEAILVVDPDGSDLARKLDADARTDDGFAAAADACRLIHERHGWAHRAQQVVEHVARDQRV